MSGFGKFRQNMREKVGAAFGMEKAKEEHPPMDPNEEVAEEAAKEDETIKEEKKLMFLINRVRKIYFEKRLEGEIEIMQALGIYYRTVNCEINQAALNTEASDVDAELFGDADEHLTTFQKIASSSINRLIRNLQSRAKAYKKVSYQGDMTLSSQVYVTDPIIGIASFSIACSATIESLINSN